tara:strand:- start:256 stop:408 length:153 start_codon:yes stop_codon:yes gene_type:complete
MKLTLLSIIGSALARGNWEKIPNEGNFFFLEGTQDRYATGVNEFEIEIGR